MSSRVWLYAIVAASVVAAVATVFVAYANIQYQRLREDEREASARIREDARDQEALRRESVRDAEAREERAAQQEALGREARAVLGPELDSNAALADLVGRQLEEGRVSLRRFEAASWQTVANSELVRGLPGADVAALARVYSRAALANRLMDQVVDLSVGVASALQSASATRRLLIAELERLTRELGIELRAARSLSPVQNEEQRRSEAVRR